MSFNNQCKECGGVGASEDRDGLCKPCQIGKEYGEEARKAYLHERASKGGKTKGSPTKGIPSELLPSLKNINLPDKIESIEDVQTWAEFVSIAGAKNMIGNDKSHAIIRALKLWIKGEEHGRDEEIQEAKETIEELKEKVEGPAWK